MKLEMENDIRKIEIIADALSSKKRLRILQEVRNSKSGIARKELARVLEVKLPTITHHLRYLFDAGLLKQELEVAENSSKFLRKIYLNVKEISIEL